MNKIIIATAFIVIATISTAVLAEQLKPVLDGMKRKDERTMDVLRLPNRNAMGDVTRADDHRHFPPSRHKAPTRRPIPPPPPPYQGWNTGS